MDTNVSRSLVYSAAQSHIFFDSRALGRFRFFPKGRRLGATKGGAHAFIEKMLDGKQCLWGDTTHANIGRYVDRYFLPVLKKNSIPYEWNGQKSLMKVGDGWTDFRSCDRPENWEGFGYHTIFLNEAGIILDDAYLYQNAVLPMLMDFADSELIAAGTPKLRRGKGRLFLELYDKGLRGEPDYYSKTFSSYDNPFIPRAQIDMLAREIHDAERQQEIFGKFVEPGGELVKREHLRYGTPEGVMSITMGVDLAIKIKTVNDYFAVVVFGREMYGLQRTFLLDAARGRVGFLGGMKMVQDMADKWKPSAIGMEDVAYQAAAIEYQLATTSLPIVPVIPHGDKITRFQPLAVRYEQGLIYHVNDLPKIFEDELLSFPGCDHDDMVDAAQIAHSLLPNAIPAQIGRAPARENAISPRIISTGFGSVASSNSMQGF